jgi:hypothetical protein
VEEIAPAAAVAMLVAEEIVQAAEETPEVVVAMSAAAAIALVAVAVAMPETREVAGIVPAVEVMLVTVQVVVAVALAAAMLPRRGPVKELIKNGGDPIEIV